MFLDVFEELDIFLGKILCVEFLDLIDVNADFVQVQSVHLEIDVRGSFLNQSLSFQVQGQCLQIEELRPPQSLVRVDFEILSQLSVLGEQFNSLVLDFSIGLLFGLQYLQSLWSPGDIVFHTLKFYLENLLQSIDTVRSDLFRLVQDVLRRFQVVVLNLSSREFTQHLDVTRVVLESSQFLQGSQRFFQNLPEVPFEGQLVLDPFDLFGTIVNVLSVEV